VKGVDKEAQMKLTQVLQKMRGELENSMKSDSVTDMDGYRKKIQKNRDFVHVLETLQNNPDLPKYLINDLKEKTVDDICTSDNKFQRTLHLEANLLAVSNCHKPYSDLTWLFTIILDMMMYYAFLGTREYGAEVNGLIGHYYSWNLITDFLAWTLPPDRRHWFTPFRFFTAFSLMQSCIWFWVADVDNLVIASPTAASQSSQFSVAIAMQTGASTFLVGDMVTFVDSNWRIAMSFFVMLHAIIMWFMYGPWSIDEVISLLKYTRAVFNLDTSVIYRFHAAPATFVFWALFGAELVYRNHTNYGISAVDAPLTSFQATQAITVLFKYYCLQTLVLDLHKRAIITLIIFICFIFQWVPLASLFLDAPIPGIHVLADLWFLADFFCLLVLRFSTKMYNVQGLVCFRSHKDHN